MSSILSVGRTTAITIASIAASLSAHTEELNSWGVWTDQDKKNTYAFAANHELVYVSSTEGRQHRSIGAWRYEPGVCWLGKEKEQLGNVLMYLNESECCVMAQRLGSRLILSFIWSKPSYLSDWLLHKSCARSRDSECGIGSTPGTGQRRRE